MVYGIEQTIVVQWTQWSQWLWSNQDGDYYRYRKLDELAEYQWASTLNAMCVQVNDNGREDYMSSRTTNPSKYMHHESSSITNPSDYTHHESSRFTNTSDYAPSEIFWQTEELDGKRYDFFWTDTLDCCFSPVTSSSVIFGILAAVWLAIAMACSHMLRILIGRPVRSQGQSTTMPWVIKTALAVLWGVCWMFYEPFQCENGVSSPWEWSQPGRE